MGRPPLPLGSFGKILFVRKPGSQVQARAKFRDFDRRVRLVARVGPSRPAAERLLKAELMRRQAPPSGGAIAATTRVVGCAECNGTGYQLDDWGGFVLNDKKRRVRCSAGPWSWVTSHTLPQDGGHPA